MASRRDDDHSSKQSHGATAAADLAGVNVVLSGAPECQPCRDHDSKHSAAHKFCAMCDEWLCRSCVQNHQKYAGLKTHVLSDKQTSSAAQISVCSDHPPSPLCFFCTDCSKLVCGCCRLDDGEHRSHSCVKVEEQAAENLTRLEQADCDEELDEYLDCDWELDGYLEFRDYIDWDKANYDRQEKEEKNRLNKMEEKIVSIVKKEFDKLRLKQNDKKQDFVKKLNEELSLCDMKIDSYQTYKSEARAAMSVTAQALLTPFKSRDLPEAPKLESDGRAEVLQSLVRYCTVGDYMEKSCDTDDQNQRQLIEKELSGLMSRINDLQSEVRRNIVRRVRFYKPDEHDELPTEFSIIDEDWVNRCKEYVSGDEEYRSVGPVEHVCGYRLVSKDDVEVLRCMFGHLHDQPLPLMKKTDFNPHQHHYILRVTKVSGWPVTDDDERHTTTQIFNGRDQLPDGRVYYRDEDVTDLVRGKRVGDISNEELVPGVELREFDELFVVQQ